MKKITKLLSAVAISSVLATSAFAADSENVKSVYVGGEFGYSFPLASKFTDKKTSSEYRVKASPMFGGVLGYRITPDIAVEFNFEEKTKYGIKAVLPNKLSENTKAVSRVYMLNFVYNLATMNGFEPYFTIGAGMAQVAIKNVDFNVNTNAAFAAIGASPALIALLPAIPGYTSSFAAVKINKTTKNCFAWQVGLGVAKEITEGLRLNLAAKMQVTHGVSINYQKINPSKSLAATSTSGRFTTVYDKGTIKKIIGTGEIVAGFTYDLF